MMSESRGIIVILVNQSKKQAVTIPHLSARSTLARKSFSRVVDHHRGA
jgi:hypothetical protein